MRMMEYRMSNTKRWETVATENASVRALLSDFACVVRVYTSEWSYVDYRLAP